nr:hypothetical protein [Lachnospiraceae bacterium]
MRKKRFVIFSVLLFSLLLVKPHTCSHAATSSSAETGLAVQVEAAGQYHNWDGVTNVAQFQGPDGNLWY